MKSPRACLNALFIWTRRPSQLLPLLGGIVLAGLLLAIYVSRVEPRYQGHSLSWWLQGVDMNRLAPDYTFQNYEARRAESQRAIQAMGTNAIPCLIRWLQSPDRSKLKVAYDRLLLKFHFHVVYNPIEDDNAQKHTWARRGFALLGKDSLHALPALAEVAKKNDAQMRRRAYAQLSWLLDSFHPDPDTTVAIITPLLTSTDRAVSSDAAIFLYQQFPATAEKLGIHRVGFQKAARAAVPGIPSGIPAPFYYLNWTTNGFTNSKPAQLDGAANGAR